MPKNTLKIATRKSPLALWQANYVKTALLQTHKNLNIELVPIVTQGDIILDSPLSKIGGKGLFVKQLEQALIAEQADIAVHSIKDIPVHFPTGLALTTICKREEARDAFVSNVYSSLSELPKGAIVGTSSLRRQSQLKAHYPHIQIKDLRGNVGTRLAKLDNGEYDAIILAAAGLQRLDLADRIKEYIPLDIILPAVGQGAIGIEARADDEAVISLLSCLENADSRSCIMAERAMNQYLQGGCQVPIACYAQISDDHIILQGLVGSLNGQQIIKDQITGEKQQAEMLGIELAKKLIAKGANKILNEIIHTHY
ncbi:hydroxymethylbilane synthase [Orbaceae bacterium ac157xtp]